MPAEGSWPTPPDAHPRRSATDAAAEQRRFAALGVQMAGVNDALAEHLALAQAQAKLQAPPASPPAQGRGAGKGAVQPKARAAAAGEPSQPPSAPAPL